MKKFIITALAGGMLLGLSACGSSNNGTSKNNTASASGEEVFKQSCSSCHGDQLQGNIGPNLQHIGAKYSEKDITNIIAQGRGGVMQPGIVQGADAKAVASWLATKK
ncbi:cytochrome c [Bacillus sp. RG28]|uniref:Cytochrome c n=1 Tax=Gottfriedia endophytica TaxID=2820819 RepID=A0A940NXA6_9BACI|nr:cytochrome c [Gottfriedia endophytica]MBP0726718.1 cytochrome c [Gottfriedia endophytica]